MRFRDRSDAGRQLAAAIRDELSPDPGTAVVVGMARGGVSVAYEVAHGLGAPLDVVVVRKLGHPRQPELGMGAIAEEGVRLVNDTLVHQLRVTDEMLDTVAARERPELERRVEAYRGGRPPVAVDGRLAIVVDDGLATGFTARAAVEVVRRRRAARVVLGVPVGPPDTVAELRGVADDVVCVEVSDHFVGLSEWYDDFHQVSDAEVARLLSGAVA